ncbi:SgcJ/EcaC family oxidoreductase [Amycolatopsis sp. cg5]|uniref:SgcJ/EcaC family oxidoreductase n=1 Tax=Amycolatopsis sp. cg5 TaxID=3238802 RepID=UPI003525C3E1
MSEEKAVLEVLAALAEAWNEGDAAAYGRLFTEDADYVTFFGMNMPGRQAIEANHRALFEGPLKGSKIGVGGAGEVKVRFVRPDVAIVVAGGGSSLEGAEFRASTVGYVLVRNGGEWRVASFQNTRVSDPAVAR